LTCYTFGVHHKEIAVAVAKIRLTLEALSRGKLKTRSTNA